MSKHNILTKQELSGSKLNLELIQFIENYRNLNKLQKEDIKILDWGSGRGTTVALLRKNGYEAYGVEIDPLPFNNGLPYFNAIYDSPSDFLKLINESCITPFPDDFFDIVFSEQVLEHISNLKIVSQEMKRITKLGGQHYHQFPAKWHLIEEHLHMPFIHWLPKNLLRYILISLFVAIGIEPYWKEPGPKNTKDKAKIYYNYSINKTHYRSLKNIKRVFQENSFNFNYQINYRRILKYRYFGHLPQLIRIYLDKC